MSAAPENLLLHFAAHGAYGEDGKELLVIERAEGPYVFDSHGNRYVDGLSSLFCAQIGYSYGEEMAAAAAAQLTTLPFNTNWGTAHPPAIELASELVERAPRGSRRVFFTNGGSESVETAWKLARQYHIANGEPQRTQGDRPRHRLPRGHPGGALVHRRAALQGAVRRTGDPDPPRLQHQPLPLRAAGRGADRRAAGRARAGDRGGGPGRGRDRDRRADPERRRLPGAAARLLGRPARDLRPPRHPPLRRRGDLRHGPARRVVRGRALRRQAGPDHDRQGADLRLRADGRGAGRREGGRGDAPSPASPCCTGSPSAAIRSRRRSR